MSLVSVNKRTKPAGTTLQDIYTVPAATDFNGKVVAAEQNGVAAVIRVSIAPLGAVDAPEQYLAFDVALGANEIWVGPSIDLIATDVVRVQSDTGDVSFQLVGIEKNAVSTGSGIVVQAADGVPSYTGITTIQFDEPDGFVVTNPSPGVAQIDFSGGSGGGSTFLSIAKWGF